MTGDRPTLRSDCGCYSMACSKHEHIRVDRPTVPPQHDPVEYDGTTADENGKPWVRARWAEFGDGTVMGSVLWTCPRCLRGMYGLIAAQPVSGFDDPRWRATVTDGRLTLEPSLGCSLLTSGCCSGHWWVRDGRMVPA